ncbi:hypothetical protein ACFWNR_18080 [Streptomyces virginiae]|uniref:hypothetical protein n=1 Tax=Streptomyces virginiae TaxID=1961 RepID=UPI0036610537
MVGEQRGIDFGIAQESLLSGPRVEGAVSWSGHGKAIPVPAPSVLRFPMNQPGKPEPADEDQVTAGPLLLTFLVALPSPCPLPHRSVITKMLPGTVGRLDGMEICPSPDGPVVPSAAQGRPFVPL